MRLLSLVLFGLFLTSPVMAQMNRANDVGHNYGGATCPQPLICPDESGSLSSIDLAASANNCVTRYLGLGNPTGFFDEERGLDSNNCLTTKPDAVPKMASTQTAPHCCIVKTTETTCAFHCDLISVQ